MGTSTGAATFNSLLQSETDRRFRGRVFASMDLLWQTGRLVSRAVGGALPDIDVRAVYVLGGTLLLVAAGHGLAANRRAVLT